MLSWVLVLLGGTGVISVPTQELYEFPMLYLCKYI